MTQSIRQLPPSLDAADAIVSGFFGCLGVPQSAPQLMRFFDESSSADFDGVLLPDKSRIRLFLLTAPAFTHCISSVSAAAVPHTRLSTVTVVGYLFFENEVARKFHSTLCVAAADGAVTVKTFALRLLSESR